MNDEQIARAIHTTWDSAIDARGWERAFFELSGIAETLQALSVQWEEGRESVHFLMNIVMRHLESHW